MGGGESKQVPLADVLLDELVHYALGWLVRVVRTGQSFATCPLSERTKHTCRNWQCAMVQMSLFHFVQICTSGRRCVGDLIIHSLLMSANLLKLLILFSGCKQEDNYCPGILLSVHPLCCNTKSLRDMLNLAAAECFHLSKY